MKNETFLSALVLLLAANLRAHDTGLSIGVNFGADDNGTTLGHALAAADKAGAIPQFNWNNANGASGNAANLTQDFFGTIQPGAVSVSWSCLNTWATSGRGEENNGFSPGGDRVLMTGYLDTTDNSAGVATVTVNGLGPEFTLRGYDVLVYCVGGVSGRGGAYTIGSTTKFGTTPDNPSAHVEDPGVDLSDTGTYVRFRGLHDASFTLTASADGAAYPGKVNFRAPINGIQIVAARGFSFDDCRIPFGASVSGYARVADDGTGTNCVVHLTDAGQASGSGGFVIPDQAAGNNLDHLHVHWRSLVGGETGAGNCGASQNGTFGGDGYSFNWGTDVNTTSTGEEGSGTGLSVTVDTFDNGGGEAPGLEIKWRGSRVAFDGISPDYTTAKSLLRKNVFVEADLNVDVSGNATFTYDGRVLTATLAGWSGIAGGYFVFGARTGGACDNHWIDDLVITTLAPEFDFNDWFVLSSGGGHGGGGDYELFSTIGQPLAGGTSGGDFGLVAGFVSILSALNTNEPPVIRCPTNPIVVTLPCSSNCVAVSYPLPTVLNGALVSCTPPSGTCLPAGVHPILCRATNQFAEAECVFTVQVVPEPIQPPAIQCPTNLIVTLPCSSNCVAVSYPPPTVLNGALVSCTPPSGTCLPAGLHPILCRATNRCSESECVFTVQVVPEPIQPPVIQCPTNFIVTLPCNSNCVAVSYSLPTVSNGTLVSCTPPSGTCLPAGVHPVLCRAANRCTEAECVFTVQVVPEPVQPPVLRITLAGPGSLLISWPAPSTCWVLEQSSTLGPSAHWTEVSAPVIQTGSNNTVTQSPVTGSRFYRLNHP